MERERIRAELNSLKVEKNEAELRISEFNTTLNNINDRIESLQRDLQSSNSEKTSLENSLNRYSGILSSNNERISEL